MHHQHLIGGHCWILLLIASLFLDNWFFRLNDSRRVAVFHTVSVRELLRLLHNRRPQLQVRSFINPSNLCERVANAEENRYYSWHGKAEILVCFSSFPNDAFRFSSCSLLLKYCKSFVPLVLPILFPFSDFQLTETNVSNN